MSRLIWHRILSVGYANPDDSFANFDIAGIFGANKDDVVVVQRQPDQSYLAMLEELGFELPKIVIADTAEELRARLIEIDCLESLTGYDPFVVSNFEKHVSAVLGISTVEEHEEVTEKDTKYYFYKTTRKKVRNPHTVALNRKNILARWQLAQLLSKYQNVLLKQNNGVAGQGNFLVNTVSVKAVLSNKLPLVRSVNQEWPKYVAQEFIEGVKSSPSVQLQIHEDGSVDLRSVHLQLFLPNSFVYQGCVSGNVISKTEYEELVNDATVIAKTYAEKGYRGRLGLNAVVNTSGIYWVEANLRRVMSSYAFDFVKAVFGNREMYYQARMVQISKGDEWSLSHVLDHVAKSTNGGGRLYLLHYYNLHQYGVITLLAVSESSEHECSKLLDTVQKEMQS